MPRSLYPFLRSVALLLGLAVVSSQVAAGSATVSTVLDTDNNATTGCVVAGANGPIPGIEQIATAVVTTTATGATVARLERQLCTGGVLGAPTSYDPGGWNVGLGNGTGGTAVVESSIPLALLPFAATIRGVVMSANGTGGQDVTSPFSITLLPAAGPPVIPVPLSPWLVPPLALLILAMAGWLRRRYPDQTRMLVLLFVFAASGLVWAATVLRDGNIGDWSGVAPAVTDPAGDAPTNADVVAVFFQQDGTNLYLRIDADIRTDTAGNQAPVVTAGGNQTITLPAIATLNGSATDDGLPNPPGALTYAWTMVSGPGTVTFGTPAAAATTASFSATGTYVLRLTASDSVLSTGANVTIVVNPAVAGNQPPSVNAGTNQSITLPSTASLSGSATDDGLPNPPGALTYAWTKVSGPGTVMFGNPASAATSATFSAAGAYVLRLTANDGALAASADVNITVNPVGTVNQPPTATAGANQTITLPAAATLAGTATDDGLPNPPGALTTTWSLVSGPLSGVAFGNPSALGTTATFAATGTYVLRLTANDGNASASSDLQVIVNDGAPVLDAIADQTITLGTRLQLVLQAADGNGNDTLTYSLVTAPPGATLNPAPLLDWMPTTAQLGPHNFTVQVTDANGHVVTRSFKVTVVFTNHAPQLAPQNNQTVAIGTPFTRKLTAVDPDANDVLTFALVAGPPGMTLSGADLAWPTIGRAPGDYAVTVRVTDSSGATDQKSFTLTLQQGPPPPVAKDDSYKVKLSQTLTVPPLGVLDNDVNPGGGAVTAARLTDPVVGTVTAFPGDGSFTYQAPATPPGDPFTVAKLWTTGVGAPRYHELVADLNGDGKPDIISFDFAGIRANSGLNGGPLWSLNNAGATDCLLAPSSSPMEHRVLADIDDSGHPSLAHATYCTREGSTWHDNIVAYDHLGKLKWVSPPLSKPNPDIRRGATPVPPGGFTPGGLAYGSGLSVARLTAGGAPVLLMRAEIQVNDGFMLYRDAANAVHYSGCRAVTGLVTDENVACRATLIISGADGSVVQALVARNPAASLHFGGPNALSEMPPIAMDIDGDGRVDLVSGTEVWMQNAGGGFDFAWQLDKSVNDTAVADLDGDGKAEIIHLRSSGESDVNNRGIFIYSHDGVFKRRIPLQTYWFTPLTIADVDGDGRSDIVLGADGTVYAFRDDGRPIWAYKAPADVPDNPVFAPFYTQPTQEFRLSSAAPQVYDLDGDGVAEVVVSGYSRVIILNGRTGLRKVDPYWNYTHSYNDVSALMLIDMNNDGHVDIVQNAGFVFNCGFVGANFAAECAALLGPTVIRGGGNNNWLPGPKAWPNVQYRSTAIDDNARVLHDTKVSRIFRVPEQRGTVRDPRLAQAASFTYEANNAAGTSAPATVIIDIVPDNQPPVFTSIPPVSLWQHFGTPGVLVTHFYDVTAFDPDPGDTITFSLKQAPTWVTMSGPARIRFEPTCGSFGNPCPWGPTTVIVTATDSRGGSTDQIFIVNLTTTSVTVPNVVGMLLGAAETALLAGGLQGVKWAEQFDLAPAGTVLAQEAAAGTVVGQFDAIRLTVSTGPQPVLMPFVIGMQLAPANSILTSAGLTVNVTTVFSNTIPAGEITAQSPAANTLLVPATAPPVALTVSAGGALPAPVASIVLEPGPGPLQRLANTELQFKAIAILTDGTSADVSLTAAWSTTNAAAATVDVTGFVKTKAGGTTTIAAQLSGKTGQVTLNVASLVPSDNTPPTAAITSPADGAAVTGPVPIVGTASDANFLRYELAFAPATDDNYTMIAEGTTAVTNGTLGTLDPTTLLNDLYTVRLRVFDRNENESVATSTVQVTGDRKVGLFSLTYQDLSVPAAGIPVVVTRTYDSRDKMKGDFGIGWRQGFNTLRLRTNRVLGTGWVRVVNGPTVSLTATSEHKVSITLADGRVEQFDMQVSPTSNIGSLDFTNVVGFQPRAGTLGQLQVLGNTSLLIVNGGQLDELVDDYSLNTYDPPLYRYTAVDGTQYEIGPRAGVTKVSDANGNTVTFGPGGILHSSGRNVVFTRDTQNRIVAITDPLGNVQTYSYDGNGDLVTHANATGGVSRYAYNRSHGLIEIRDAGNGATRNEYDASGRLVAVTDANGNQVQFSHNDAALEEVVTDRRGNVVRLRYDAEGNVVSREQGVTIEGAVVNAAIATTYDALGNETSIVDADGRRTTATFNGIKPLTRVNDPGGLNLTTSFAYNARSDVTSAVDTGGRSFAFTYDARGNVTAYDTPLSGAATSTANARGQATQSSDALGTTTAYTYDAAGQVTREDVLGASSTLLRRRDFSYDASGNRTTSTLYRTIAGTLTALTTRFGYDAANRLVTVTDPLGGVSRTEYDAAGRVIASIDPLGRRTTYTFDAIGQLARTTYADGTFESMSYDADGNVVSQTDRAGRTTTFAYDEINRRIRTTAPGGSSAQTIYSAGGRVSATIDGNGHRTDYAYDAAGRLITTTLPAVANGVGGPLSRPRITRTLNSLGAQTSVTDPGGRVTTYAYDASGRLVQTTFADGTIQRQAYDALGRRTSIVNEEGQITSFGYDGLSRLVSVSGLAGDISYAYDEAGNVVTQTDALGRITRYRYDALDRLIEMRYPGGEAATFAYDAVGNLVATTDPNGRTISFVYDAMNRATRRLLPGGASVNTAYAADGQRSSVTDARGTTTYNYDAQGRLAGVSHPDGAAVGYTRDANGNLLSLTAPGSSISYGYDALDRLVLATTAQGASASHYDLASNRVRTTAPNGVVTDAAFDTRNRPLQLTHRLAGGPTLQSFASAYSPAGRRTRLSEADGSIEDYAYDARGRLTSQLRTGTNPLAITHAYDAVGNRTQTIRAGASTTFSYNGNDQLVSDGTSTYAYDANGNLVSRSGGGASTVFGYDADNRLRTHSGNSALTQYIYDHDGNRVEVNGPAGFTRLLVDSANTTGLSQVLEERDGAGNLVAGYAYGNALLSMTRSGVSSFFLRDAQNSVRALANSTGSLTDRYQYDAYGGSASVFGSTPNPYRYGGERLDADSGLYQLRARDYDAALGRFVSRDPFAGVAASPVSRHRYLYANADPVNFRDPTGLFTVAESAFAGWLNNTIDVAATFNTVSKGCGGLSTVEQVSELMFYANLGIQLVIAGGIIASGYDFGAGAGGFSSLKFGPTGEIPLLDGTRYPVPQGWLERVQFGLVGSAGKIGIKGSFKRAGMPGTIDYQLSGPPIEFKGGAGFKGAGIRLATFRACGTLPLAQIDLEPNFKLYGYTGGAGTGVGGTGSLDLKFGLFNNHFKASLPLMGMDVSGKGVNIYLGGLVGGI